MRESKALSLSSICTPNPCQRPTVIPTWYLHMMSLHVSGGVPEQTVRNEAVGIHTINEWKCSLQRCKDGKER